MKKRVLSMFMALALCLTLLPAPVRAAEDTPESGEDENAGNNADAAVSAVQTMIDALPIVSELDGMTADELDAAYDDIQAAYDAYEALNAEQQAQITAQTSRRCSAGSTARPRCWRTHSPASIPTVSAARTAVQRSYP